MVNAVAKYQKYAEYKDSGVEWLGEIPIHWDLFALKRSIDKCTNGFWGAEPDGINDLCVLRVADFDRDNFKINLDKLTYRSVLPKEAESRLLKNGDLLIEKSGGGEKTLVGCVVQFDKDFPAITSNFVAKMTPNSNMDSRFLTYSFAHLYSGRVNYPAIKQTTGIQNLDSEAYLMENFCFPSKMEQIKIANFLDHETAKIDSLIEKQQQLIELLKEKRQAVISHAVTKGLNPNVPMKDSGVEWLGQVPEHWGVSRLKNIICSLESGCSVNAADIPAQSYELGVLKTSCVYTRSFRIEEKIRKGAIIISRMNTPELVGASALVKVEADNIYLPDRLWQTKFFQNIEIDAEYLSHFMTVQGFRDQIALGAEGASSSMQNIAKEDYLNINCLVPPLKEQIEIRDFIERKLAILSELNMKAQEAVECLKERRTALISAAVTGKIDVRNWQNPTEAKMEFSA